MININNQAIQKLAKSIINADPTISISVDEITSKINTIGLSAFIESADIKIRELVETMDLISIINSEEPDNES
jgi:hypothetical protein